MRNLLIISALALAGVSQAVVLDDFSTGDINDVISSGVSSTYTSASVPGGFRYVGHNITANPFSLTHATVVTNGIFVAASKSSVDALTSIAYGTDASGVTGSNDMNLDLSAFTQFTFSVLSNDEPGTVQMNVRSNGVNSGNYIASSVQNLVTNNVGGTQVVTFDFSDFSGMDFSDVDSIAIIIDTDASGDVVIDTFEAVPEPTTLGLAALGLGALARRRKKNQAKKNGSGMKKNFAKIGLFIAALSFAIPASALVVVDDFTTGSASISITSGSTTAFQNGSMLGGDRMTELTVQSNNFGLNFEIDAAAGLFSVSSQPQVDGQAKLGYGYMPLGAGAGFDDLGVDLTGENGFEVDVFSNDEDAVITIALRSATNPGTLIMSSKNVAGNMVNTNQTISWSFAEFAGVDFSTVNQILLEIETPESGDITLSEIRAVPEPGTMLALGAGAALLLRRKFKKS